MCAWVRVCPGTLCLPEICGNEHTITGIRAHGSPSPGAQPEIPLSPWISPSVMNVDEKRPLPVAAYPGFEWLRPADGGPFRVLFVRHKCTPVTSRREPIQPLTTHLGRLLIPFHWFRPVGNITDEESRWCTVHEISNRSVGIDRRPRSRTRSFPESSQDTENNRPHDWSTS